MAREINISVDSLIRTVPRGNLNSEVSEAKGNICIEKAVGQVSPVVFSATSAMRLKVYNGPRACSAAPGKRDPIPEAWVEIFLDAISEQWHLRISSVTEIRQFGSRQTFFFRNQFPLQPREREASGARWPRKEYTYLAGRSPTIVQ